MAKPKLGPLHGLYRRFDRLLLLLSTALFIVRYYPFLSGVRHLRVQRGSVVRPFWSRKRSLTLEFKGENRIGFSCIFQGSGEMTVGEGSYFSHYCVIGCNERIRIGRNVMIGSMVTIRDTEHNFGDTGTPMISQGTSTAAVRIEDDVWIGHGVMILKGVTIGEGAIVAAGSAVTKDVPKAAIVAGIPARVVKQRGAPGSKDASGEAFGL